MIDSTGDEPPGCGWKRFRRRVLTRHPAPVAPAPSSIPARQIGFLETSATVLRNLSEIDDRRAPIVRANAAASAGATALPAALGGALVRPSKPTLAPLPRGVDPEVLKEMGNREFRKGRFAEAISMYDRAIGVDGNRAAYWSNKAAALAGLGRLLEAVEVCREAVRIDGSFFKAQHRLADLYIRLGDSVKAMHHYQLSGGESNSDDFFRLRSIRSCINNATEARKHKDWQTVLRDAKSAILEGADSAPQVFALQAEALLKLQRHEEADKVLSTAPTFDMESSTKFFGAPTNAYVLSVGAQVDLALGRFDEGVAAAERALRLDPTNKEVMAVARRARAVSLSRAQGNELFNQARYREACAAYQQGLEHEPHNSVLLCNRAASQAKLQLWEEAVAGCEEALKARPSYHKARLRRADCNFQLKKWEEAIQDYEILTKEDPGDEEVIRTLWEARFQLMKERRTKL